MIALRYILFPIAFLYAARCLAATVTVTVGNGGNFFSPASFTINPGDTVKWVWNAGHHNTASVSLPAGAVGWYSNIDAGTLSYSYSPTVSGLYKYTCTHHSGMDGEFFVTGCSYPGKPTIIAQNGGMLCFGDTIDLNTQSQAGVTYQWLHGGTAVPGAINAALKASLPGLYKVLVNRCGVDSASSPYAVVLHALPQPSFSYTGSGLNYFFTNGTASPSSHSFLWSFGDGSSADTNANPVHGFPAAGNYAVKLVAGNKTIGCVDSVTVWINTALNIGGVEMNGGPISVRQIDGEIWLEGKMTSVALFDATGQVVFERKGIEGRAIRIDTSGLPVGVYILNLCSSAGCSVKKLFLH